MMKSFHVPFSRVVLAALLFGLVAQTVCAQTPTQASNQSFLASNYIAMLARDPDSVGWIYWLTMLNQGQTNRPDLTYAFIYTPEYTADYGASGAPGNVNAFVTQLYVNGLGRTPDSYGLSYWAGLISNGTETRAQAADSVMASAEFLGRNGVRAAQYHNTSYAEPTSMSLSGPAGGQQTLSLTYTDADGSGFISYGQAVVNAAGVAGVNGVGACYTGWDRNGNLYLGGSPQLPAGASGTVGQPSPGMTNEYCAVDALHSTISYSGNTMTVSMALTFTAGFGGTHEVYSFAYNTAGLASGWQDLGQVTTTVALVPSLSINGVPGGGHTLATVTAPFTFGIYDSSGANDVAYAQFYLADSAGNAHCYGDWGRPNALDLYDGTTGVTTGFGVYQADSFCTVSLVSITNSLTDSTEVTVALNFTFNPGYSGTYTVLEQVNYVSGVAGPWHSVGSLVIDPPPVLNPQPTVTLTDNTQSSGYYVVGDSYTVAVLGPPNQPVSVNTNGVGYGTQGYTNAQGMGSISGTWSTAGSYTQTWFVAGIPASRMLFQVAAASLTCSGITPPYLGTVQFNGTSELWTVTSQGVSVGASVTLLVWNEAQTITDAVALAANPGAMSVTFSSGMFTRLGSYTVQAQVTAGARKLFCPGKAFFAVFDDTKQPAAPRRTSCNSMAGTWTSPGGAKGPLVLTQNADGTIIGSATATFPCGTAVWPVTSSGVSNGSVLLSYGTPTPATLSCATLLSSSETHQITFTNSACDGASDSATATYPDGSTSTGVITLTSALAVPTGESSTFVRWDTAAGYSTEALFTATLPALSNGEQFGGRTVLESALSLTDGCNQITGSKDIDPVLPSDLASSWNVQSNNSYYYDLMGYGPAIARYYQTYAGNSGCALQLIQAMSVNANFGSQATTYTSHAVTFSIMPASLSVTRDNASSGVLSYPTQ